MAPRGPRAITLGRLALTSAAAVSILLAGCDEREHLSDVVQRAGNDLIAATGGGVAAPPVEVRAGTYASVIRDLQSALKGAEKEPGAGAARLLIAQAMVGQGDIAAENASRAQSDLLYTLTEARSRLDLHSDRSTFAEALSVYDPEQDLSQLDLAQAEIERELATERRALTDRQNRITQLDAQMKEERGKAEALVSESVQIRAQATDAGAVQRAGLITEANRVERNAAQHERRFAELQLLANALEDESKMIRIRIASHQRRDELVREARERIESSARLLNDEAREADIDAQDLGSELGGSFDELMETLEQRVRPAFDEASTKYRSAISQAQQARGDMGQTATALIKTAQHSSANLHRNNAEVYESVITLAQRLARDLGASRFEEVAAALAEQRDAMLAEAADLYDSAGYSDFAATVRGEPDPADLPVTDGPGDSGADAGADDGAGGIQSATDVPE